MIVELHCRRHFNFSCFRLRITQPIQRQNRMGNVSFNVFGTNTIHRTDVRQHVQQPETIQCYLLRLFVAYDGTGGVERVRMDSPD